MYKIVMLTLQNGGRAVNQLDFEEFDRDKGDNALLVAHMVTTNILSK